MRARQCLSPIPPPPERERWVLGSGTGSTARVCVFSETPTTASTSGPSYSSPTLTSSSGFTSAPLYLYLSTLLCPYLCLCLCPCCTSTSASTSASTFLFRAGTPPNYWSLYGFPAPWLTMRSILPYSPAEGESLSGLVVRRRCWGLMLLDGTKPPHPWGLWIQTTPSWRPMDAGIHQGGHAPLILLWNDVCRSHAAVCAHDLQLCACMHCRYGFPSACLSLPVYVSVCLAVCLSVCMADRIDSTPCVSQRSCRGLAVFTGCILWSGMIGAPNWGPSIPLAFKVCVGKAL